MKNPSIVTVTGAAGQIAYSLLFRIAAGEMLGKDQPIRLHLLDIAPAMKALKGVAMELQDCAFPLLRDIVCSDDPNIAFKDAEYALLVGARPRGPGMERKDLLEANSTIFSTQGKAIDSVANPHIKVLVVGNPANTNAFITMRNAPSLSSQQFTAMTRLDHNRAVAQVAAKLGVANTDVEGVIIWGNHSATQFPDLHCASAKGVDVMSQIDVNWYRDTLIPVVQQRGAAIIEARGLSSAASAANAAICHMRDWALGSDGEYTSMAVVSGGEYDIEHGLIYSFPCVCRDGEWQIVRDIKINDFARDLMQATERELIAERDAISHLLP